VSVQESGAEAFVANARRRNYEIRRWQTQAPFAGLSGSSPDILRPRHLSFTPSIVLLNAHYFVITGELGRPNDRFVTPSLLPPHIELS
jgi:hypothetical protein